LIQFLHIARASLAELETQIEIAHRLGFASDVAPVEMLSDKVFAKLNAMLRSLQPKPSTDPS
jgi:four helix bundle protein